MYKFQRLGPDIFGWLLLGLLHPLTKLLLLVPTLLGSASLEVLVLKGREATQFSMNWKLKLLTGHFGLLMPLNQQAKNELIVLAFVLILTTTGKLAAGG